MQKLEIREALLGKKSGESSACLVVALVHSLDRFDCDFILYGTRMLMVVVKLFNDQRRKEDSSSARSTSCSRRKEEIWEDPPTALFFVGWLFLKQSKTVRRLVSADILQCLEEETKRVDKLLNKPKRSFQG